MLLRHGSPLEEMKYLFTFTYFNLFPLVPRQKHGIEFRYSTQSARRIRRSGVWSLNTRFPLPILLCAGYNVNLILFYCFSCRKTQGVFDKCMLENLNMDRPPFGYFCEARVHDSKR